MATERELTLFGIRLGEEEKQRPRHTPGQAEGVDEESERKRPEPDAIYRKRPSQAEGESEDEADEVPPQD